MGFRYATGRLYKPKAVGGGIVNVTAGDNFKTIRGQGADFATARATSNYQGASYNYIGCYDSGGTYTIWRLYLSFDTSFLGAGATVNQVNLTMTLQRTDIIATDGDIYIVKFDWSAYDPIDNTNREAVYDLSLSSGLDDSIWVNTTGKSSNTPYISGNLDTDYINKTGKTYYSFLWASDYDNSYNNHGRAYIYFPNYATEAYRPYLTIDYS